MSWTRLKSDEEYDDSDVEYTQNSESQVVDYVVDLENDAAVPHRTPRAVLLQTLRGNKRYADYPARKSRSLGEAQIGVGIMAAILNGIGFALQLKRIDINVAFYVFTGFWGLVFFCLSGGFAIAAAKRKTSCPIVGHLVLAIFGGAAGLVLAGQGAGGIAFEITNGQNTGHLDKYDLTQEHHYVMASLVISVFLLICGLLELGMCVWGSALSCRSVCCGLETTAFAASRALTSHPPQPMIVVNGRAQAIIDNNSGHVTGLIPTPAATHGNPRPYNPS